MEPRPWNRRGEGTAETFAETWPSSSLYVLGQNGATTGVLFGANGWVSLVDT